MNDLPGDLTGSNPLVPWLNKLKAAVARRTLLPGTGYERKETTGGTILRVKPGGPGGGGGQTYRVKSRNGDYLVCRTFDGTTEGRTDVKVAVPFDARSLAGETLDGTAFTYTYTSASLLNRTRTSNTGEVQQVVPLWKVDGLIKVAPINYSGVSDGAATPSDIKLIEESSRCWARV